MAGSFGELLRGFRIAASLTQEALAERCRISPATIAAIEQGRRNAPRLSTVRLIAEALELPAADREALARAARPGIPAGPGLGVPAAAPGPAAAPVPAAGPARPATGQLAGWSGARTSFIGRDRELAAVVSALAAGRMVSLVGPGGVGKTRLAAAAAAAVAARYPLGAVFVDLVPVREGFVSQAVAALLGVTEGLGRSLDAALYEFLSRGPSLLVLDNCEHVLEMVAAFTEKLLANCPGLTILATSRERLAVPGEHPLIVPPLSLMSAAPSGSAGSEAEVLFTERARASDAGFAADPGVVAQVCARLDGMPLAIELAAARCVSLGLDGLVAGLDDHLRLLSGSRGGQERHRSLRAVIDWSHDLLDGDEQAMFRRLGAFVGGFDLDAAVAVSAGISRSMVADLVGRLTDKSLLTHRRGPDGSRWQLLEVIRAYALDRLAESDEWSQVRHAHLAWAAAAADELEQRAVAGSAWRAAFDTVADDLRAALDDSAAPAVTGTRYRLAGALGHLAYGRRFLGESRGHYQAAAALAAGPAQAAASLRTAADVAMAEGDGAAAFELLLAAGEQARLAGDDGGHAAAVAYAVTLADRFAAQFPREVPHDRLRQLLSAAAGRCPAGDLGAAAYVAAAQAWTAQPEKTIPDPALSGAALDAARRTGDPVLVSAAMDAVVGVLDASGRLREAHQVVQERTRLLERLPRHDPRAGIEIVDTYHMAAEIAVTAGDLPAALAAAAAAAADDIAGGQPHFTASKPVLALVLQGQFDAAEEQGDLMWEAWQQAGRPAARWMGSAVYAMVLAHGLRGDESGRRTWLSRVGQVLGPGSDAISRTNLTTAAAFTDARIALHEGRTAAAVAAIGGLPPDSRPWYGAPGWYSLRPYAWAIAAEVAVVAGVPDAGGQLAASAPAGEENHWAAACLARAAGRLHGDRDALERAVAGWERIDARFERACTLMLLPGREQEGADQLRALGCEPPRTAAGTAGPDLARRP